MDPTLDLQTILALHAAWRQDPSTGQRADLSQADLQWTDLHEADLSQADLHGAYLRGANLSRADLSEADLSRADLSWANLRQADLSQANLRQADLSQANLHRANLRGTGVYLVQADRYTALFYPDGTLQVGCWRHPWDEWEVASDKQIRQWGGNPALWKKWKPILQGIHNLQQKEK